jgi:hypothetical protein
MVPMKEKTRPTVAGALRTLAKEADLEVIEVKKLEIVLRANGDVIWRGWSVDGKESIGGICST